MSYNKDKLIELAEILTEKEVIFEGDLKKIFGERPFAKEIAEAKTQSKPKEKESPKEEVEETKTESKSKEKDSSKEEIKEAPTESKSKETESPKEEIKEENSK